MFCSHKPKYYIKSLWEPINLFSTQVEDTALQPVTVKNPVNKQQLVAVIQKLFKLDSPDVFILR